MRIDEIAQPDFGSIAQLAGDRGQRYIQMYRDGTKKAFEDNFLIKREFDDIRQAATRLLEQVIYRIRDDHYYPRARERTVPPDVSDALMNTPMSITHVPGFIKRLNKSGSDDIAITEMLKAMKLFLPIVEQLNTLKGMVGKKPSKADKEAAAKAAYTPPPAEIEAIRLVSEELRRITQATADAQTEQLIRIFQKKLQDYLDNQVDEKGRIQSPQRFYARDPFVRMVIAKAVTGTGYRINSPYARVDNADEVIAEQARKIVSEVHEQFVAKNTAKLVSIIAQKGNMEEIKTLRAGSRNGIIEAAIVCKFRDGSEFFVEHKAVFAVSNRGTAFFRYPTTFHDVTLPDGSRMKTPSEERMNEIFAKA